MDARKIKQEQGHSAAQTPSSLGPGRVADSRASIPLPNKKRKRNSEAGVATKDRMDPAPAKRKNGNSPVSIKEQLYPATFKTYREISQNAADIQFSGLSSTDFDEINNPFPSELVISVAHRDGRLEKLQCMVPDTRTVLSAQQRAFIREAMQVMNFGGAAISVQMTSTSKAYVRADLSAFRHNANFFGQETGMRAVMHLHIEHLALKFLHVDIEGVDRLQVEFIQDQDSDLALISAYQSSNISRSSETMFKHIAALEDYMIWSGNQRSKGIYRRSIKTLSENAPKKGIVADLEAFRRDLATDPASRHRRNTPGAIVSAMKALSDNRMGRATPLSRDDMFLLRMVRNAYEKREKNTAATIGAHTAQLHALLTHVLQQADARFLGTSLRQISALVSARPSPLSKTQVIELATKANMMESSFYTVMALIHQYCQTQPELVAPVKHST